jgi:cysteinyl-tRNA synthetase
MLKIYNTLGRKLKEFKPREDGKVGIYACGPTVYDYAHIGHGRKYVNDDTIRRTMMYLGYQVKHVMNVTDVGHLVSDGDEGEDKLEKGAKKHGKTVWEVAEFFTQQFIESMNKLNIIPADVLPKATEHIKEQIDMIQKLFENGFAYDTTEAVYFDITKFENYSELYGQKVEEKEIGVRDEVIIDTEKRHPADFALWFKRVGKFENHTMHWDSPWGDGFPGWHIECSAMSTKYLGEQFDIHTGGEDHISVHHTNEIAQTEGATGKRPFVNYWIHHSFLKVDNQKMSKSLGNFYTIEDIINKGFTTQALRYLYLSAHYRTTLNFTWQALESSENAYKKLLRHIQDYEIKMSDLLMPEHNIVNQNFKNKFTEALEDDFNTPKSLAVLWEVIKSDIPNTEKLATILDFDRVLGLGLETLLEKPVEKEEYSNEVKTLIYERSKARDEKDWAKADELRDRLKTEFGVEIVDK